MPEKDPGPLFAALWVVVDKTPWELLLQKRVLEKLME